MNVASNVGLKSNNSLYLAVIFICRSQINLFHINPISNLVQLNQTRPIKLGSDELVRNHEIIGGRLRQNGFITSHKINLILIFTRHS